jgi:hypothetical protein
MKDKSWEFKYLAPIFRNVFTWKWGCTVELKAWDICVSYPMATPSCALLGFPCALVCQRNPNSGERFTFETLFSSYWCMALALLSWLLFNILVGKPGNPWSLPGRGCALRAASWEGPACCSSSVRCLLTTTTAESLPPTSVRGYFATYIIAREDIK